MWCEDDADDQAPAAPTANHKNIHVINVFNIIAAGLVSTSSIDAAREKMFTIFVQDET